MDTMRLLLVFATHYQIWDINQNKRLYKSPKLDSPFYSILHTPINDHSFAFITF